MKKQLLAAALACGVPLAQAQTWTRLVGDAPGQSTPLATTQALATDEDGTLHVQTTSVSSAGHPVGHLYAFGGYGDPLPWLTTTKEYSAEYSLKARGVATRDGRRVSWYGVTTTPGGPPLKNIVLYKPGEATADISLILGSYNTVLEFFASDGVDGAFAIYDDLQHGSRPNLSSVARPNVIAGRAA